MATNFPNSPSNGDTHTFGGATYTYNSTIGAWTGPSTTAGGGASVTVSETAPSSPSEGDLWFDPSVLKTFVYYNDGTANQWVQNNPTGSGGSSGGGASVTASDTAPTSPSAGDLWFKSDTGALYVYYTDADSSQWVGISGPAGADGADGSDGSAQSYANLAAFPSSGNTLGDLAVAQDTKALYVWDGTEWDRVYTGANEILNWDTEPNTEYAGAPSSNISITVSASDPDGFPVTYSYDTNPTNPTQLQSVSESNGVFTLSLTSTAGQFSFRPKATDGVHVISKATTVNSAFQSATAMSTAGITTSGNYNLYLDGFSNSPTECYVNFDLAGGPWILVMVVASGTTGNSYDYDSTVWTNTTGGVTTALDPSSDTNQISSLFYTLSTTATGLALGTNASTHFHYYNHSSYTARALANGALSVPTGVSHDSTTISANSEVADGDAGIAAGWTQAFLDDTSYAWNAGATYFRYGYEHGIPYPTGYGYIRFGHSADVDSSDSRDRVLGIGLKNNGSGPLGSNTAGAGGLNYITSTSSRVARTKGFLYIKN